MKIVEKIIATGADDYVSSIDNRHEAALERLAFEKGAAYLFMKLSPLLDKKSLEDFYAFIDTIKNK